MLRVPSVTPPVQRVARLRRSARATCSRRCASSLPLGVPSGVARALRGLYRRSCRARSAWLPHGLHLNGGQRCRPPRHRAMDTRENKGCKEAAGVHSCAGRRGRGLFTCLWSCLLSALGVLRVLRGLHVRFCDCLWICLPMSYLFCALCMFCRQPGRSMGIRSSMGIRMSRDTSMSRGTSTSR